MSPFSLSLSLFLFTTSLLFYFFLLVLFFRLSEFLSSSGCCLFNALCRLSLFSLSSILLFLFLFTFSSWFSSSLSSSFVFQYFLHSQVTIFQCYMSPFPLSFSSFFTFSPYPLLSPLLSSFIISFFLRLLSFECYMSPVLSSSPSSYPSLLSFSCDFFPPFHKYSFYLKPTYLLFFLSLFLFSFLL